MDVYEQRFDYSKKQQFNFAFLSDIHLESATHRKDALQKDLDEAVEREARIYIGGDLAELILPGDMKRYTRGKDSINEDAALNEITDMCFKRLEPYAEYIDWMGVGNHEESTLKYNHYDLTLGVLTLLNRVRAETLAPIHHGGYKSFIRFRFEWGDNGKTRTVTVLHYHGKGGSSPVTKGMIDINRLRCDYDADIYWIGHKHTQIADKSLRLVLDRDGNIKTKEQRAFFTAGYQGSFEQADYTRGYKIDFGDRQLTTTSIGCAFLEIDLTGGEVDYRLTA